MSKLSNELMQSLQAILGGNPTAEILLNEGTFGGSYRRAYPFLDEITLEQDARTYTLFATAAGGSRAVGGDPSKSDTNITSNQVPESQLWILWGLRAILAGAATTDAAITVAQESALRHILRNAYLSFQIDATEMYWVPVKALMGSQQYTVYQADDTNTSAVSRGLQQDDSLFSMEFRDGKSWWPLILQSKVKFQIQLILNAPPAAGNAALGFKVGFRAPATVVGKTVA